jgi:hypothetical protein
MTVDPAGLVRTASGTEPDVTWQFTLAASATPAVYRVTAGAADASAAGLTWQTRQAEFTVTN